MDNFSQTDFVTVFVTQKNEEFLENFCDLDMIPAPYIIG